MAGWQFLNKFTSLQYYNEDASSPVVLAVPGTPVIFFLAASAATDELPLVLLRLELVPPPPPPMVKLTLPGFNGRKVGSPSPGTEIPQCLARTSCMS